MQREKAPPFSDEALGLSRAFYDCISIPVFIGCLPHPLPFIQPHLVSYHRDELRVGGFSPQVVDGIAEVAVEGIHISPVPCYLDGVADGALHAAGGGTVFLGDFRVQALGHGVDVLRLVHGEQDGIPQELVALDVGGHGIRVGNKSKSKSYYLLV